MPDFAATLRRVAPPAGAPAVLLVGFERPDAEALRARLAGTDVEVVACATADPAAARALLGGRPLAVVCLGEHAGGEAARRLIASQELDEAPWRSGAGDAGGTGKASGAGGGGSGTGGTASVPSGLSGSRAAGGTGGTSGRDDSGTVAPLHIVAAAGPDPQLFQDLIAEDRIFYLSQRPPSPDELAALIGNAVRLYEARRAAGPLGTGRGAAAGAAAHASAAAVRPRFELSEVLRALALQPGLGERAEVLAEAAAAA